MCGKFTAMLSWDDAVFLEAITNYPVEDDGNDAEITFRVMSVLSAIVWDREARQRRKMAMRWGFPHRDDPRRPDPIHARTETIDEKPTFRDAFLDGRRGIVLARTFNEAPDSGAQHVITPGYLPVIGIAFLWRRFGDLAACVMVTVPANQLLMKLPTDRMPAVLAPEDWAIWLGEEPASHDRIKACLKTTEGVRWRMTPEQRAARPRRKPTVADPGGLF